MVQMYVCGGVLSVISEQTDLLGGNFADMTLEDWTLPAVVLKALMDVDTGIFQKLCGSTGEHV